MGYFSFSLISSLSWKLLTNDLRRQSSKGWSLMTLYRARSWSMYQSCQTSNLSRFLHLSCLLWAPFTCHQANLVRPSYDLTSTFRPAPQKNHQRYWRWLPNLSCITKGSEASTTPRGLRFAWFNINSGGFMETTLMAICRWRWKNVGAALNARTISERASVAGSVIHCSHWRKPFRMALTHLSVSQDRHHKPSILWC